MKNLPEFYPQTRAEWRNWLAENHATARGIWIIYYKKHTGVPTVSYAEAVEEALCFGWIDSTPNKIDDACFKQLFTPRNAKSPWSKINKQRIEALEAVNLMTNAGRAKIEQAKQDGSWTLLDAVEELIIPDDLQQALNEAPPKALETYSRYSNSVKKATLWQIVSAKRPETRAKRIQDLIQKLLQT